MPIKYTVTYSLPDGGDPAIFDSKPSADPNLLGHLSQCNGIGNVSRIDNKMIHEYTFPTYQLYFQYMEYKTDHQNTLSVIQWSRQNNVNISVKTESI